MRLPICQKMSDYADLENSVQNQTSRADLVPGDDDRFIAKEEHNEESSTNAKRRQLRTRSCTLIYLFLKCASFMSVSTRLMVRYFTNKLNKKECNDVTDPLLGKCETRKGGHQQDEYSRTFQTKMMCLDSMQLPYVLVDQYRKVHDPEHVALIDKAVQQIHQHRESVRIIQDVMRSKSSNIMEESEVVWKAKLRQHESIIELHMNQLVDASSRTKDDRLVEMVDATAQSAAESQHRQALIDLNKQVLSSQTADPVTLNVYKEEHCPSNQAQLWIPTMSEEDIERHRRQLVAPTCELA